MSSSILFRLSGLSCILAGVAVAIGWVAMSVSPSGVALNTLIIIVGLLLAPLAITGLYLRQREESGSLGAVAYFVTMIGVGLVTGLNYAVAFVLLSLSESQRTELLAGTTGAAFGVTGVVSLVGVILFGIATFRAGVFSRVPAVLLVIGNVPLGLVPLFPPVGVAIGAVVFGAALIWLGSELWSARGEAQVSP
ncbi:MAG: hypothetical protein HY675_02805 [Chloroflexi bacterium]|nr:hypothetical protein [Chloroflexota bacterium]